MTDRDPSNPSPLASRRTVLGAALAAPLALISTAPLGGCATAGAGGKAPSAEAKAQKDAAVAPPAR